MTARPITLAHPAEPKPAAGVVTPTGVWVVDTRNDEGRVARKDVGGLLGTDVRLYVGGRDRTELVPAIWKQVASVRAALGPEWAEVPFDQCCADPQGPRGQRARPTRRRSPTWGPWSSAPFWAV